MGPTQNFNFGEEFNRQIEERLTRYPFPMDKLPARFHLWLGKALSHCTLEKLGCEPNSYLNLVRFAAGDEKQLSFFEVSFALNSLQYVTPDQLGQDLACYAETMAAHRAAETYWNQVVLPIRNEIAEALEKRASLAVKKPGLVRAK